MKANSSQARIGAITSVLLACVLQFGSAPAQQAFADRDPGAQKLNHECAADDGVSAGLFAHCGEFPDSLPMTFVRNASGRPVEISGGDFSAAVSSSISAWSWFGMTPFVSGGTTSNLAGVKDSVNTIGWGNPSSCGQPGAVAVACLWFAGESGTARHRIVEMDIILSTSKTWHQASFGEDFMGTASGSAGFATASWIDLQSTITHELGHALGLDDIGNNSQAWPQAASDFGKHLQTMYRWIYMGSTNKRTLDVGDLLSLRYVYENM